ncbi:hypothetical protein [Bifidobacterium simiarum]|uniref:hypothetical protein n=1 Tax=Bifidobacterium simiarum TaxID=2045441 RepID=UPI001BDCB599|nr:hypothetical protein [Bifidobacterium simiarum]MBT1166438.1 hypothetical protein [Bifidobacterium simiarum]
MADAIAAAQAGQTVVITANTDEHVSIDKKLNITADKGVSFAGTLTFNKGADGSSVKGVTFDRPAAGAEGTFNAVALESVTDITVSGNVFNSPSALFQGKEWQYNGVWVRGSANLTIADNEFNLGRLNDTNGTGTVAADSNSNQAVNLVGWGNNNIHDVTIKGNQVTVTAPAADATRSGSIQLLIAMGNSSTEGKYGIQNVTVEGNTYNGAADSANARFAGLANVKGIRFVGNTVSNAAGGIFQSIWQGSTSSSDDVSISADTYTSVQKPFAVNTNEAVGALLTDASGKTTSYGWIADAVKAANAQDGATITVLKNVSNHSQYTFNTKVTFTAAQPGLTFNGSIRLKASGSKVSNLDFLIDNNDLVFKDGKLQSGSVQQSVIVSNGAKDVEIAGNTFSIPSVYKGQVDFQPSSIWLEQGVSGTNIHDNTFKLGRSHYNSAVGINFVGGTTPIANTTVNNNTVTFTKDAANVKSGSAMFVVANGNTDGKYGVQGITASGNVVDGTALPNKSYAVAISDVKGLHLTDNKVTGTYMALSYSSWQGKTSASTDIVLKKNALKDNVADVYFNPLFNTGKMTSKDVVYGSGADANVIVRSTYEAKAPYVNGLAFAGWYTDSTLSKPAQQGSKDVVAYLIPVEQAYKIQFLGGSLRVDTPQIKDTANLRFSYRTKMLGKNLQYQSAGWSYTIPGINNFDATAKNPYTDTEGYTVNNLVLTNVPKDQYDTAIRVRMSLTYKTPDGTSVTVFDPVEQSRSVNQVAKAIVQDGTVSGVVKDYAQGLLDVSAALR